MAAVRLAHELDDPDAVIVVLLPDSGRGYLTKVFDDAWLAQYGFLGKPEELTVGDVLRGKDGRLPDLVHTHPNETIAEAVHILREYGVSQMPVVRAEPPVMAAEVAGSVSERDLLVGAVRRRGAARRPGVEQHMAPPLPSIGARRAGLGSGREAPRRRRDPGAGRRQAGRCPDASGPARVHRPGLNEVPPAPAPQDRSDVGLATSESDPSLLA